MHLYYSNCEQNAPNLLVLNVQPNEGFSTKEILKVLNVRNRTQVKTWWLWYQNEESMFVSYLYPQSLIICLSLHFSTNQCYNLDNEND